jgi:hypothetical protein
MHAHTPPKAAVAAIAITRENIDINNNIKTTSINNAERK